MAEKKAKKTKEEEKNHHQDFDFDFDESEIAPLKSYSSDSIVPYDPLKHYLMEIKRYPARKNNAWPFAIKKRAIWKQPTGSSPRILDWW